MFFELEDIKRRRMPTWYLNNTTGWHTAVDSTPSWNMQRGFMIGLVACYFQEYLTHFIKASTLLSRHYEPPTNASQAWTWFKETRNLEYFTKELRNVRQIALYGAAFDIGLKVAVFRQFNSGWQSNFAGFEWSYYRKIPTMLGAFMVTSPFAVAGQMVRRAVEADKTFPKELQKGYKSYFDAFRRIPFEEGPYYLFKNTFPLYVKHIMGPFFAFYSYDWLVDKASVMWRASNVPMLPVKSAIAAFTATMAAFLTYPFVHGIRDMVDFWPKKDGVDPFKGNYRKAAVWLWYGPSINIGYAGLFRRYFWHVVPLWFTTICLADRFGMFSYWRIDIMSGPSDNTAEDSYI